MEKTQLHTVGTTRLQIGLKPGVWIAPSRLLKQIVNAAFQPRYKDFQLTLSGVLKKDGSDWSLVVNDFKSKPMTFRIIFEEGKTPKEGKARKSIDELEERAGKLDGLDVELEGWWRNPEDTKVTGVILAKRLDAAVPPGDAGPSGKK